jgi:hypothetical protein
VLKGFGVGAMSVVQLHVETFTNKNLKFRDTPTTVFFTHFGKGNFFKVLAFSKRKFFQRFGSLEKKFFSKFWHFGKGNFFKVLAVCERKVF